MYSGDIYKKGSSKTIYAYMALNKTLYAAGTKQTVQGYSAYSGTLYTAGTAVNKIGTSHSSSTYYKGDGGYITGRGDPVSVNVRGAKYPNRLYVQNGTSYSLLSVSLYYDAGPSTYYKGNGSSGYLRGTSVDAIEYDGTLYEKGSSVTPVSVKVTGLYQANDNENWTYTPIGTSYSNLYQRNSEDDEVVSTVGEKCSLDLATFVTKEVTALTT